MQDNKKSKQQLIEELQLSRKKIKRLETTLSRHHGEKQLSEKSRQLLYGAVQGSHIPTFIIDSKHLILYWNRALEPLSNIQAEDVIGTNQQWRAFYGNERPCMADLIVDNRLKEIAQWYAEKYTESKLVKDAFEATDFFPDLGEAGRWLRFTAAPIRNDKGRLLGAIETLEDVTEKKEAEALYKTLVEMSFAGVYIVQGGKFQYLNHHAARYAGYHPDELVGARADSIVHPDDRDTVVKNARDILHKRITSPHEFRIVTKEGHVRWILETVTPISYKGRRAILGNSMDITERRRMEDSLRESEERYRTLIETTPDLIFMVDEEGRFSYVNPTLEKALGYDLEELKGKPFTLIISPEEALSTVQRFKKASRGKPIPPYETELISKSGGKVSVEFNVATLWDAKGRFSGRLGIGRDISERLYLENELKEKEVKYRSLFESANDAIFIVEDDIFIDCNPKTLEMYGCTREQIIGQPPYRFSPPRQPDGRDSTEKALEKIRGALNGHLQFFEWVHTRYEGTLFFAEVSLSLLKLDGKDYILAIVRDVTERKRAERAINEAANQWKTTFNAMGNAIALIDSNGRITACNSAMAELSKVPAGDLIGQSCYTVIYGTDHPIEGYPVLKAKETQKRESAEMRIGEKWFGISVDPLFDEDGSLSGCIHVMTDVSERKKLESQLLHAQKMEAVGTLAGGTAHDFNNLLMAIQGNVSLITMDMDPMHPYYERLRIIENYIRSGANLTKQLLSFARGGRYEVRTANMNEILEKTASMFGRTKKEITINRKFDKEPWMVDVDQGQMEQVFMNLFVNAWQAMQKGGDIFLETSNIYVTDDEKTLATAPGRYVKISVTDTGSGMDDRTKARIFEPFFTTKEIGRGAGLGLAMVYGIIKGHKGIITVYSEIGHGTTFNIYLPASDKKPIREREEAGRHLRGTESILLVDDEKEILEVTGMILKSLGYSVFKAATGQECIAVYMEKKNQIQLVILDMILPGISGSETFDQLKKINPDVKIILSSGYSINGDADSIMRRGCRGFLQKPFNSSMLSQKIREILDS